MTTTADLRNLTLDFLVRLPATIKDNVLLFVIIYAIKIEPPGGRDYEAVVHDYLLENKRDIFSFGRLLSVISAVDYILADRSDEARTERRETTLEEAAAADPKLQPLVLKHPLRLRHLEKSLADWNELRSTVLNLQRLQDFEDILMEIPPKK
jgi:hypothetical protein